MFFSDLDRTLIYSKRFLADVDVPLIVVEDKDGREISYMTEVAYKGLQSLREKVMFVPVTARKWDEIMRIGLIRDQMPPVIVCESGRAIYRNGKRDSFWDVHVESSMKKLKSKMEKAFSRFDKEIKSMGFSLRVINEYMWMAKVEVWENGQKEQLENMIPWFNEKGYLLLIQERKIYLMPKAISKDRAVRYLIHLYQPNDTISAGDTDMDAGMFNVTTYSIAPKHHTIPFDINSSITNKSGIYAGEEIIDFAKSKLC